MGKQRIAAILVVVSALVVVSPAAAARQSVVSPRLASRAKLAANPPILGRRVASRTARQAPSNSRLLGRAVPGARVAITLSFKPRSARLLAALAAHAAGHPGMPIAEIRRVVSPPKALIAQTTAYLHRYGFSHSSGGILTETYAGSVGAAERAFHTTLGRYRSGRTSFRSPITTPTLPRGISRRVQLVSGLDTYPLYRPLASRTAKASPVGFVAPGGCTGATDAQTFFGAGYTAQDLAGGSGYNTQSLLGAGNDGNGGVLDLVEYSTYSASDNSAYESCYGITTPISSRDVSGGATNGNGRPEVQLDDQFAASTAPGLDGIINYDAPGSVDEGALIDAMISDASVTHVTEISSSWGLCEPVSSPYGIANTHNELEIAAVAGIPFLAATGDDGSQDCRQQGISGVAVDYPASDPYTTAVGGTTLNLATVGTNHETAWGTPATPSGGGGGGGVSNFYPMPSWQTGTGVIESGYSSKGACGQVSRYCRELPDVSLDANPDTGPIYYCTGSVCGFSGWQPVGGTSDAAPMLAAMVADADTYSLAHGGARLGFANPFLYSEAGTSMFNDATVGTNGTASYAGYPAAAGYDMATGLGSVNGAQLATDLAAYTNASLSVDHTALSGTQSRSSITPGRGAVLRGTLTDHTSGLPLNDRPVIVEGFYHYLGSYHTFLRYTVTNSSGGWAISATTKGVKTRMDWQAYYPGEEGMNSAISPARILHVTPKLTANTGLRRSADHTYHVKHGSAFKFGGSSSPNLHGSKVTLQYRLKGARRWRASTLHLKVGSRGTWTARLVFSRAEKIQLRWHYTGSTNSDFLSANSNSLTFTAS
jgi:kumamolisin